MICRQCQRKAWGFAGRFTGHRNFTISTFRRNAAVVDVSTPDANAPAAAQEKNTSDGADAQPSAKKNVPVSSCPAGTVLTGLNYFKGKTDPVAMADEEYPEWLWRCLEVIKTANVETGNAADDEFSKSKKQRRIAAKQQRKLEAELLASGNIEALAPKIPLQHQSINLPGEEGGGLDDALMAAEKRNELRRAMRQERRAKIKESNYLKSM